ncbi:hypothetical protein [Mycobacteroides chelonae]|uniref:hypothetical protein n=1 Tax=Mycobacteroides chelonae TaxID=1774 RepID=UPI00104276EA|nr:hypothetical protein [Mycobacteroides chelonae]
MQHDTSKELTPGTLARIAKDGQPDEFRRVWPLAITGLTADGRSIFAARNVQPTVEAVRAALANCESCGMTHLEVTGDSCG